MNREQMKERCPSAILIGSASLKNYKLAFSIYSPKRKCGCADIIPQNNSRVYGLLYKLNDENMTRMDDFEGVSSHHYQRITVTILCEGKLVDAYTYEVIDKKEGLIPSEHYVSLLQEAAKTFNFPIDYQLFLSKISAPTKD